MSKKPKNLKKLLRNWEKLSIELKKLELEKAALEIKLVEKGILDISESPRIAYQACKGHCRGK